MSDEWKKYVDDSRMICKYGIKCYQKNPQHTQTYKHPPAGVKRKFGNNYSNAKRCKVREKSPLNTSFTDDVAVDANAFQVDTEASPKHGISGPIGLDLNSSETEESALVIKESKDSKTKDVLTDDLKFYDTQSGTQSLIKDLFLVDMPADFYSFYKFLMEQSEDISAVLSGVNLQLIGPFEFFLGKMPIVAKKELYLTHWRFFYDPPEFQAVLKVKGKSQFHIGYYRDVPEENPVFLASNDSAKDCHITPMAENIFGALNSYLQKERKRSPFTSMACQKLIDKVKCWALAHKFSLEEFNMKKRQSTIVTKTFHGAGITVPYNKKTELGYRPLIEKDATIKKMFKNLESAKIDKEKDEILSALQPVITYGNIAMDECDFGTGLELGINLFCSGLKELEQSALSSLCTAYSLLKRDTFAKIIQAHLKHRRKGPDMSILNIISD